MASSSSVRPWCERGLGLLERALSLLLQPSLVVAVVDLDCHLDVIVQAVRHVVFVQVILDAVLEPVVKGFHEWFVVPLQVGRDLFELRGVLCSGSALSEVLKFVGLSSCFVGFSECLQKRLFEVAVRAERDDRA